MTPTLLIAGSSIFEQWASVAEAAPGAMVVNRAVGGTTTAYWVAHLPELVTQVHPSVVWLYCGSNDLNVEVPETTVIGNLLRCRGALTVPLVYFGIIKAPQKAGKWDQIARINQAVVAHLQPGDRFVDTDPVFFPEGAPLTHYFVEDGLHLTEAAYAALTRATIAQLR